MHTFTNPRTTFLAGALVLPLVAPLEAQVTPAGGWIYDAQLLGSATGGCVASGPGGTFVGCDQFLENVFTPLSAGLRDTSLLKPDLDTLDQAALMRQGLRGANGA